MYKMQNETILSKFIMKSVKWFKENQLQMFLFLLHKYIILLFFKCPKITKILLK